MSEKSQFETAEVGDWFERDRGHVDHYKVVEIEETFGDRVRIVTEHPDICTKTDAETVRSRFDESTFNRQFEPVDMMEVDQ
jgi:hypothetical protein